MTTTVIEEIKKNHIEIINLKEELLRIKTTIITEEKLIQIFRKELGTRENKCKNELEKMQREVSQIKINNNSGKSSGLDFSDFQMPPDLPWGKTLEPRKNKDKNKLIE